MNQDTRRSLDRVLDRLEKQSRGSRRRFSTAPIMLGLGLILGNMNLTALVPMLWDEFLPGGLDHAETFRGWPALVWKASILCQSVQGMVWLVIGSVVATGLVGCWLSRSLHYLVWLSAVIVIAANAGILAITLQTSLMATRAATGL